MHCFFHSSNTIACGPACLAKELKRIGFKIVIEDCIVMPNNYYIVAFKKFTEEQVNVALKKQKNKQKQL